MQTPCRIGQTPRRFFTRLALTLTFCTSLHTIGYAAPGYAADSVSTSYAYNSNNSDADYRARRAEYARQKAQEVMGGKPATAASIIPPPPPPSAPPQTAVSAAEYSAPVYGSGGSSTRRYLSPVAPVVPPVAYTPPVAAPAVPAAAPAVQVSAPPPPPLPAAATPPPPVAKNWSADPDVPPPAKAVAAAPVAPAPAVIVTHAPAAPPPLIAAPDVPVAAPPVAAEAPAEPATVTVEDQAKAQKELDAFIASQSSSLPPVPEQPSTFVRQTPTVSESAKKMNIAVAPMAAGSAAAATPTVTAPDVEEASNTPKPMDIGATESAPPPPAPITGPLDEHGLSMPDPAMKPEDKLSPETKQILSYLPQDLTGMPQVKPKKDVAISRANKDVELPGGEVKKSESMDMNIMLKQPKIDVSYELQKAYDALVGGNTEGAISIYQDVLSADPQNKTALFGLATTYHRLGLLDEARPLYGKLLALDPNHTEALNNFLALVGEESPEAALSVMEKLADKNPSYSPIPAQMAILYQKTGDMDKAIHAMRKAYSISPENLVYLYNLGILYDKKGDKPEAAAIYKQLLEAYERGQDLPASTAEIQERLTFLLSNNQ